MLGLLRGGNKAYNLSLRFGQRSEFYCTLLLTLGVLTLSKIMTFYSNRIPCFSQYFVFERIYISPYKLTPSFTYRTGPSLSVASRTVYEQRDLWFGRRILIPKSSRKSPLNGGNRNGMHTFSQWAYMSQKIFA